LRLVLFIKVYKSISFSFDYFQQATQEMDGKRMAIYLFLISTMLLVTTNVQGATMNRLPPVSHRPRNILIER